MSWADELEAEYNLDWTAIPKEGQNDIHSYHAIENMGTEKVSASTINSYHGMQSVGTEMGGANSDISGYHGIENTVTKKVGASSINSYEGIGHKPAMQLSGSRGHGIENMCTDKGGRQQRHQQLPRQRGRGH